MLLDGLEGVGGGEPYTEPMEEEELHYITINDRAWRAMRKERPLILGRKMLRSA